MTSILKGLAALVAMVMVGHGAGVHATKTATQTPRTHPQTDASAPAPIEYQRGQTDIYAWLRGHAGPLPVPTPEPAPAPPAPEPVESAPEPAAEPAPAPVAAPVYSQPIAQLPIAVHPAPPPAPAPPAFVVGSTQQALINQDRAGAGLGGLNWNSCLASVAYQNALRMANQGYISHAGGANQSLGCGLGNTAGENVGYWSGGINDYQLNTMFMNSPGHRANIMGNYRFVGTAWVTARDGKAYIAVEFG